MAVACSSLRQFRSPHRASALRAETGRDWLNEVGLQLRGGPERGGLSSGPLGEPASSDAGAPARPRPTAADLQLSLIIVTYGYGGRAGSCSLVPSFFPGRPAMPIASFPV